MTKEQKTDEAINWWYDISDHQTTELIMKHKLRKPIKEQDVVKLFALYGVSKTKGKLCDNCGEVLTEGVNIDYCTNNWCGK